MGTNELVELISTIGFPMAMCLALFWYMVQQNSSHKEEINGLKDTINKLELAITKLCDKLDKEV